MIKQILLLTVFIAIASSLPFDNGMEKCFQLDPEDGFRMKRGGCKPIVAPVISCPEDTWVDGESCRCEADTWGERRHFVRNATDGNHCVFKKRCKAGQEYRWSHQAKRQDCWCHDANMKINAAGECEAAACTVPDTRYDQALDRCVCTDGSKKIKSDSTGCEAHTCAERYGVNFEWDWERRECRCKSEWKSEACNEPRCPGPMYWDYAKDRCSCPPNFVDELVEDFGTDEERCKTKRCPDIQHWNEAWQGCFCPDEMNDELVEEVVDSCTGISDAACVSVITKTYTCKKKHECKHGATWNRFLKTCQCPDFRSAYEIAPGTTEPECYIKCHSGMAWHPKKKRCQCEQKEMKPKHSSLFADVNDMEEAGCIARCPTSKAWLRRDKKCWDPTEDTEKGFQEEDGRKVCYDGMKGVNADGNCVRKCPDGTSYDRKKETCHCDDMTARYKFIEGVDVAEDWEIKGSCWKFCPDASNWDDRKKTCVCHDKQMRYQAPTVEVNDNDAPGGQGTCVGRCTDGKFWFKKTQTCECPNQDDGDVCSPVV